MVRACVCVCLFARLRACCSNDHEKGPSKTKFQTRLVLVLSKQANMHIQSPPLSSRTHRRALTHTHMHACSNATLGGRGLLYTSLKNHCDVQRGFAEAPAIDKV